MKTVLLIGLGRFGRHLAMQLNELGHQVMAVDKDEERVNECMSFVTNEKAPTIAPSPTVTPDITSDFVPMAQFLHRCILPYLYGIFPYTFPSLYSDRSFL